MEIIFRKNHKPRNQSNCITDLCAHTLKSATINIISETNSLSQIVRQLNVSGKRMSKILIKRQHVQQTLPFNHVNVAVSESSHIGRRLTQGALPPEGVPEDVAHS